MRLRSSGHRRRSFEPRRRMSLFSAQPTRSDHRTKTERPATILLPNSVAARDTKRDVTDGRAKPSKKTAPCGTGHHGPKRPQTHYECVAHRLSPCGDFSSPRGKRQCASQWRLAARQRRRSLDSRVNAERAQASICCPSTRPYVSPPVNSGALRTAILDRPLTHDANVANIPTRSLT